MPLPRGTPTHPSSERASVLGETGPRSERNQEKGRGRGGVKSERERAMYIERTRERERETLVGAEQGTVLVGLCTPPLRALWWGGLVSDERGSETP